MRVTLTANGFYILPGNEFQACSIHGGVEMVSVGEKTFIPFADHDVIMEPHFGNREIPGMMTWNSGYEPTVVSAWNNLVRALRNKIGEFRTGGTNAVSKRYFKKGKKDD